MRGGIPSGQSLGHPLAVAEHAGRIGGLVGRDIDHGAHSGGGRRLEDIERPHDVGPVSYTHLDVYKRQLYGQLAVSSLFAGLLLVTFIVLPPSVLLAFAPDTSRTQWAALIFATSALNATTMLYALDRGYQNFGRGAVVMILGLSLIHI